MDLSGKVQFLPGVLALCFNCPELELAVLSAFSKFTLLLLTFFQQRGTFDFFLFQFLFI